MDIRHLLRSHADFPDGLREIDDSLEAIYARGDISWLESVPKLAVVGSRQVTPYGHQVTTQLAGQAAGQGIAIISGLALGVDALAHQAALKAGGHTLAVLANGLDQITPAANYWLGQKIIEQGGALVSEYPPDTPVYKLNFVARNRIVAGLSDGVLITEAAAKSGTLHTANFALEQGKPVMAVPGNINSPLSAGTNNLIKAGAIPVTDIKDILDAIGIRETSAQPKPVATNPEEAIIIGLLQAGTDQSGELLQRSGLSPATFNQTLTMLEITGRVQAYGGGYWGLK